MVKPPKIKNYGCQRAYFIPADSPRGIVKRELKEKAEKREKFLFSGLYKIKNNMFLLGGIGAPAAVLALEPLICSGFREIIILGFCGGLSEKISLFEPYVIKKAFSEEGTSLSYFPNKNEFPSSNKLSKELEDRLKSNNIDFKTASIVSTDAPYRETRDWINLQQKKGIELVDMETSAVFALAEYYHMEAAALMLVSDVLGTESHQIGFLKTKFNDQIKQILSIFYE